VYIRRIAEDDFDAVCALIARNLREVNSRDYPAEYVEALVRAHGRKEIAEKARDAHMIVAVCDGGSILGCGAIREDGKSGEECMLHTVFVLPELHGQGIGRRIVQQLESDEFALRAKRLAASASVTAERFYLKIGYTHKGGARTLDDDGCIRLEKVPER
jgi:GNAT superfamily N-acetyltransferase